jgi:VanZ family protein
VSGAVSPDSGRALRRAVFAGCLALQLVVLYWPRTPSESGLPYVDKLIHFTVFALVVVTAVRAGLPRLPVFAVLALHAPVSELIQHYVLPHRDGDWTDATADLVGVAAGVLIVTFTSRRRA